jgi:hypothetical protein
MMMSGKANYSCVGFERELAGAEFPAAGTMPAAHSLDQAHLTDKLSFHRDNKEDRESSK